MIQMPCSPIDPNAAAIKTPNKIRYLIYHKTFVPIPCQHTSNCNSQPVGRDKTLLLLETGKIQLEEEKKRPAGGGGD